MGTLIPFFQKHRVCHFLFIIIELLYRKTKPKVKRVSSSSCLHAV